MSDRIKFVLWVAGISLVVVALVSRVAIVRKVVTGAA